MNQTLSLYQRLIRFPMGKTIFTRGLTFRAPYFASIHPLVTELHPGYCSVRVKDRRSIRNHIGSIHAGAMCTLSELVGGLAVETTIPSNLRWIPREMSVEYSKKAKGTLTAICEFDPQVLIPGDIRLPLDIKDESGDVVLMATITFYISERPAK
jgi:acyl-coenzyme A thioesterase PaaI-like protein